MTKHSKQVLVGTHRQVRIEDTLRRLMPMLGLFEITRVANVTGLDDVGIPTVMVTRPNARSLSVSQGKGLTLDAAKVSGIMEAIEQWHAERVSLPVFLGSYRERASEARVVDPVTLPGYAREWDPDARILWLAAETLGSNEVVQVPFELVHLDMTLPLPAGSGFFPISSNGLASGNTLEEAILHGVCELIERDAMAVFYQMPTAAQAARRLRIDSIDDASCLDLIRRFEVAGVGVSVWNVTSDAGVATFLCAAVERELNPFRPVGLARGFGCHPDRAVALSRALCEAAQSRLTRIAGSRDDIQSEDVAQLRAEKRLVLHQRQLEEEALATHLFASVPSHRFEYLARDLEWVRQRLGEAGLRQVLYVRLTRPEIGIEVVRVIVPGLEGPADISGYVSGRRATRAGQPAP